VSSLRESFERASLPAAQWLNGLPRVVPFLAVLALAVGGIFLPAPGWILIAVVVLLMVWVLALSWPSLNLPNRLMRLAVIAIMVAITVTQAVPRA
jgi:hypothetical protein